MKTLSFDGKGINNKSAEYAPRVATFSTAADAQEFGELFAHAPDLLESLMEMILIYPYADNATTEKANKLIETLTRKG